ncbi:MAG: membrane protein insertase YidC [Verrucomicrobia bacterium]|nr:membrane protein insertase YidC [Verrucomicrobiota bacterium]MBU1733730.1 membrane protein insertase YidC [Verrucomicrobiota bacterium]MBU1855429.1 membrane protein insertase YidC [Verrucomicrobiota bacterium]
MKKQDLIIIVALFALMLAWPMVYTRFFKPPPVPAKPTAAMETARAQALTNQASVRLSEALPSEAKDVPAAIAAGSNAPALPALEPRPQATRQPEQRLTLTNANMVLTFSSWGGGLVAAELPQYRRTVNKHSGPMVLDFSNAPALTYAGFPELSAADDFTLQRDDETGNLRVEKTTSAGLHFTRLISFGADYQIIVQDTCRNEVRQTITLPECGVQLGSMRLGKEETKTTGVEAMGIDVLHSSGGEGVKYWAGDLPKLFKKQADEDKRVPRTVTLQTNTPADWVAVKSKFFVQILAPEGGATGYQLTAERALAPGEAHDPSLAPKSATIQAVEAQAFVPARTLNPGESVTQTLKLYTGPKKYSLLRKLGLHQEDVMDFGMWSPLCKFLLIVLNATYSVIPNYGVAIILLTILIRILFWPLTHKSTESMKKMQELQPLIAELRKKHKDNPRKLQEETMAMYKQHKVNPVSGCLPMLIQIPVFIALFVVLRSAIELRFADFLWIKDLSEPERLIQFGFTIPLLGWDALNILPIFMAAAQAWQQSMTPATDAAQQKMMLFFMPVMMLVMFYSMPSALVLYWSTNTVIMIAQQLIQKNRAALKKLQATTHQ